MNHLGRMIEALVMANPLCMGAHFDDGLAHCIDASVAGAAALRGKKIDARPVPCSVLLFSPKGFGTIGLNARATYDWMSELCEGTAPSFENWLPDQAGSAFKDGCEPHPVHMLIEARFRGKRALVDLTIGQMRKASGVRLPLHLVVHGEGWPVLGGGEEQVYYKACPYPDKISQDYKNAKLSGYTDDLTTMMDLALECDLDMEKYLRAARSQLPDIYDVAAQRIVSAMG